MGASDKEGKDEDEGTSYHCVIVLLHHHSIVTLR